MQTFLPFPSFKESAQCLDTQRLGKQLVEAWQILMTNERIRDHQLIYGEFSSSKAVWRNHPAVAMWRNYESLLAVYGAAMCEEWKRRGYKDSLEEKFLIVMNKHEWLIPPWISNEELLFKLNASHQSVLLAKDPEHYASHFPGAVEGLSLFWPRYSTPSSERIRL